MPSFSTVNTTPSEWVATPYWYFFNISDLVFMYAFFIIFIVLHNSMSLSINNSRLKRIESKGKIVVELLETLLEEQNDCETFYLSEKGKKLHRDRESRHLKYANNVTKIRFTEKQVEILRQLQCISEDAEDPES